MVRRFYRNGINAHQLFPQFTGESFSPMKEVRSCRGFATRSAQSFLDRVDGVVRHRAVCGSLAAHDADEAALRVDLNDVVARNLLRTLPISGADQRTRSRKAGYNIRRLQRLRQIFIQLPEQVGDLFLGDVQIVAWLDFSFRRSDEQTAAPGRGKEHAPGFGFGNQHGVVSWEEVQGKHHMRAYA